MTIPETGIRSVCDLGLADVPVLSNLDEIEPGDLVLCKTSRFRLSRLIARMDGYWCHSAIYIGDGKVAQATAGGIGTDTIEHFLEKYEAGLGIAQPDLAETTREEAVDWATKMCGDDVRSRYAGRDLGVSFSLLRRAKKQPGIEALETVDPFDADDAGEGLFNPPDFESTCSGFAYQCYSRGANTPLEIVPAPGIRINDEGHLWVPTTDDLLDELLAIEANESLKPVSDRLTDWADLAAVVMRSAGGITGAALKKDAVPMEIGVTPNDLWQSPSIATRHFGRDADRMQALEATAEC